MEIWALANQKGGTGKTTTAIHLAAALANHGKRCLLVDLDPQAHATLGLGIAVEDGRSIASTFLRGTPLASLVRITSGGFHLVPSELALAEFEELAERSLHPERILSHALEAIGRRYDWVVVDCPPRADGVLTRNAIRAADTTLLVVETGAFAMQGALRACRLFEEPPKPGRTLRLLATMYDRRERVSREFLIALQARFGPIMLDTVIRRDEALREAVATGVPVLVSDHGACAAADFDALACEVLALRAAHERSAECEPTSRP